MEVEKLVEELFLKLSEKEEKFYFVSSILNFLEDPDNYDLLKFAHFSNKGFQIFFPYLKKIIPVLQEQKEQRLEYKAIIITTIAFVLSNYKYVFLSKNNISVQSSLIFALVNSLHKNCLEDLINYIFEKRIAEVIARPQLYNISFTFSTIIHEIISKGYDELASRIAIKLENKSLLFIKNIEGLTPADFAIQYECPLTFEYITQIKKAGEEALEEDWGYW